MLPAILHTFYRAIEKLFHASTIFVQERIHVMVYDAVEHIIINLIWTVLLVKKFKKHVQEGLETGKVDNKLEMAIILNDDFLA